MLIALNSFLEWCWRQWRLGKCYTL